MSSNGKILRSTSFLALLLLVAGCGGINASKSVSPLDFFMPGIGGFLKADPMPANPDPVDPTPAVIPVQQVAQI